jgi:TIGR03009 family protein
MSLGVRLFLILAMAAVLAPSTASAQPYAPGYVPAQQGQAAAAGQQPQPGMQQPGTSQPAGAPVQVAAPPVPQIPFTLTADEEAKVDELLQAWEYHSGNIKTFECKFKKIEYDANWAAPPEFLKGVSYGALKFAKPDKGSYQITHIAQGDKFVETKDGEHWVCDGKSIFMKEFHTKTVREYPLPPNLQGKSISDGPMPFVFGVEKDKLKARYWVRFHPGGAAAGQVSLEAFPKHARDAAEFKKLDIQLTDTDLTPVALQIHKPNSHEGFKVTDVYVLENISKNAVVARLQEFVTGNFVPIPTPLGWKRVVEDPSGGATSTAEAPRPMALPPR